MICRSCEVAGYLEEESVMEWYSQGEADSIYSLARAWHDRCDGCDCEVKPHARGILPRLRAFLRGEYLDLPVQRLH